MSKPKFLLQLKLLWIWMHLFCGCKWFGFVPMVKL